MPNPHSSGAWQAITVGFPAPNYVCNTGTRQAILPGTYLNETQPALPVPPGQAKKHHVLAEMERAAFIEEEPFALFNKRVFTVVPLPVPHIKPYHHVARIEEPEPDWAPLIRGAAQGPLPTPPRQRPWHHLLWLEEADPDPIPGRRQAAITPLATPPRQRPWWHNMAAIDDVADDVALSAQAAAVTVPPATGGGGAAWWWLEYVRARLAEQRAPRLADCYAFAPPPSAAAEGEHVAPPHGLEAVAAGPIGFGTGNRGIAVAARLALHAAGKSSGDVGAQGVYAGLELRPSGAARGLVRVEGGAAIMVMAGAIARADHARAAGLAGRFGQISARSRGQFGAAGVTAARVAIAGLGKIVTGPRGAGAAAVTALSGKSRMDSGRIAQTGSAAPPIALGAARAFAGNAGRAGSAPLAIAAARACAEHEPDDEEALTIALLLAA
jgi:hypothetical protein